MRIFGGVKHLIALPNAINCNIQPVHREISEALTKKNTFTSCLDHISPVTK